MNLLIVDLSIVYPCEISEYKSCAAEFQKPNFQLDHSRGTPTVFAQKNRQIWYIHINDNDKAITTIILQIRNSKIEYLVIGFTNQLLEASILHQQHIFPLHHHTWIERNGVISLNYKVDM